MSHRYQEIPTATAVAETNTNSSYSYGGIATPPYADKTKDDDNNNYYNNTNNNNNNGGQVPHGEVQPPAFRDVCFNLLFWIQMVIVVTLSIMYATGYIPVDWSQEEANNKHQQRYLMGRGRGIIATRFLSKGGSSTGSNYDDDDDDDMPSMFPLAIGGFSSLLIAPTLTITLFPYLYRNATSLIQASIYAAIIINVILAITCLVSGAIFPAIMAGVGAFLTWLYAKYVWHRIPLAAANLKTAIASLQSQLGVAFLGLAALPIYIIWWGLWIYFFIGSLNTPFMESQVSSTKVVHSSGFKGGDDDFVNTIDEEYSSLWYFLFFLMLVSFYWTNQVISNTVQTTVAGSVGTYWFVPQEAVGCCSPALTSSLFRSVTYSFGSICMGSLIVAIIQAMRAMVQQARESARNNQEGGGALILCLAECLLSMIEAVAEYFNKWAFIYVGLYGYAYIEAGKNVLTLFRERGWSSIISDNLTARVLGMMSFVIGLGSGILAAIVALITSLVSTIPVNGGVIGGSLILALIVGMILASIVFTVVNGATDTIIVLFAESPAEFQQNHPTLSAEMNQAWSSAYPDMFTPIAPTTMNV